MRPCWGHRPCAVEFLSVMARSSIQIDTITCNAAVSACEKGGEWARALDILGVMARSSIQMDTFTCSVAISACEKRGMWRGEAPALLSSTAGTEQHPDGYDHMQCCHQCLRKRRRVGTGAGCLGRHDSEQHPHGYHHMQCCYQRLRERW